MVCEKDAVGIRSSIIGKVVFPMGKTPVRIGAGIKEVSVG
jgi:hypothetical protein